MRTDIALQGRVVGFVVERVQKVEEDLVNKQREIESKKKEIEEEGRRKKDAGDKLLVSEDKLMNEMEQAARTLRDEQTALATEFVSHKQAISELQKLLSELLSYEEILPELPSLLVVPVGKLRSLLLESKLPQPLYRPGEQLNVKLANGWCEVSLVSIDCGGKYGAIQNGERELTFDPAATTHVVSARVHFPPQSRVVFFDNMQWHDGIIAKASAQHNKCEVQNGSLKACLLNNPFNICPLLLQTDAYASALRDYRNFVLTRYSYISDPLSAERLNIEDQCVPVKLVGANTTNSQDDIKELMKATEPLELRSRGYNDVSRILVTATAASGKTVMLRQVIYTCCKWGYRDANDTVPILIPVIDLQRSMAYHAHEYQGVQDLAAVYLRLTFKDNDDSRYLMLMQAYDSRRALLLLDGLDEGGDAKERIEWFVTHFLVRQRLPLVVTSRPGVAAEIERVTKHFHLDPLTSNQQKQIITSRLGPDAVQKLWPYVEKLARDEGQTICGNPLMLSMVISIFQNGRGEEFPKTRFALYETAVATMLTRLDVKDTKDLARWGDAQRDHVRQLVQVLALDCQKRKDKDILDGRCLEAIGDDEQLRCAWEFVQKQVLSGKLPLLSCLEPVPIKLRFSHLSMQEFLCAQEWLTHLDRDGSSVGTVFPPVEDLVNDSWWHNALALVCEGRADLLPQFLGSPPHLRITGLVGKPPMVSIPNLISSSPSFLDAVLSLDLR